MNKKEKTDKIVNFAIKKSLYDKFKKICDQRYKSLSEQIRELIVEKVAEEEKPTQPPLPPSPPDNEFLKEGDKKSRVNR